MYLNYYNFRREPFQITPDPEFLFLSPSHKEAMASIIYGIEGKKGFIAIVGGVGVGKTTILRSYLEQVNREKTKIIYVFNANLSFKSLLTTIYQELGITPRTDDIFLMVNQLSEVLIEEYKNGGAIVLIVDEAQNMPVETLENLRMLSNLETATDKLIQIVLIGQPEFNDKLNLYELRQLKQRVAIRTTILPLTKIESERYIRHRLSKVMIKNEPVLSKRAMNEIVRYSKGIPRVINVLCDNAFITGYGYQKKPVTAKIIREICADFDSKRNKEKELKTEYFFRWKVAAAIVLAFAAIGVFWISPYRDGTWDRLITQVRQFKETQVPTASVQTDAQAQTAAIAAPAVPENQAASALPPAVVPVRPDGQGDPAREAAAPAVSVGTPQAAAADMGKQVSVTVERGDTLSRLMIANYGAYDSDMLQKIKNDNPSIKDVNRIYAGETIVFPQKEQRAVRRK